MPLNIDFQQVLLHLLNFVILFGALYFLLYGPVKKFMEKREQEYRDMDEQAKSNLADSEKMKAEYEQKLKGAELEASKLQANAQAQAEQSAQAVLDEAKENADKLIKKAQLEAQKEHDELITAARRDIADAASQMAEKIIGESVADSYDRFIAATEKRGNDD